MLTFEKYYHLYNRTNLRNMILYIHMNPDWHAFTATVEQCEWTSDSKNFTNKK